MSVPSRPSTPVQLRPSTSARSRPSTSIPIPTRPTIPYISLDDPYTKDFFTRKRIQNHLRRAGLLNKQGEILTQAEYDSKQTDVAIGRENQRKIDDAIKEVLEEMAREHWAHARQYTDKIQKDVYHQLRRIEDQYRRRNQPITIRHSSNGRMQLDSTQPINGTHSDVSDNSTKSLNSTLPPILSGHSPKSSSHLPTEERQTDLDNIRQELEHIKDKLADLNAKLNTTPTTITKDDENLREIQQSIINLQKTYNILQQQQIILNGKFDEEKQRKDKLDRQIKSPEKPIESSEKDKQSIEQLNQISTVINQLKERILILETNSRPLPTKSLQEEIDQAIKTSEKKTIDREHVIENLTHGLDDKIKQIESRLSQILTKLDKLPDSNTYTNVIQTIQNHIKNMQQTQKDNDEWKNLARDAVTKVNQLEIQLNQFIQSTKDNIPRSVVDVPINSEKLFNQQPLKQANRSPEPHSKNLPHPSNTTSVPPNLALIEQRLTTLENYPRNTNDNRIAALEKQIQENFGNFKLLQEQIVDLDRRKLERSEITEIYNNLEQKFKQDIQNLNNTIMNHLETRPDRQTVGQYIQQSEEQINQKLQKLNELIDTNQRALKNAENYINDLYNRLDQQPKITLKGTEKSNSEENPLSTKPTLKELQAIMPFVELLPTFDMFTEKDWI